jgi:hypothetical protein
MRLRAVFRAGHFHLYLHPDLPLTSYAQGQLGILPTYAQSYLYVAYRYLIGMGFDPEEQAALLALWMNGSIHKPTCGTPMPALPSRPGLTCERGSLLLDHPAGQCVQSTGGP